MENLDISVSETSTLIKLVINKNNQPAIVSLAIGLLVYRILK